MNETIVHRQAPGAPCFCVGQQDHDPECACAVASGGRAQYAQKQVESRASIDLAGGLQASPEGGDHNAPKSTTGRMDAGCGVVPKAIKNAIKNIAGGEHPALVQRLLDLLGPHFSSPWAWTGDAMPPMGVPVICLDDANKPHDICVATRDEDNDWGECMCWWMHIPPAPEVSP